MSVQEPEPPTPQSCGIINIIIPVALAIAIPVGWRVGHAYGIWQAFLGAALGLVLTVPLVGLMLAATAGIVFLLDRFTRPKK